MSNVITFSELDFIMERFGQDAVLKAQGETFDVFPGGWFPPTVLMALGLRETNLTNICGGANLVNGKWVPSYTDRGWLQVTDTFASSAAWLKSQPGCPNGPHNNNNWDPDMPGWRAGKVNALTAMHCPTMTAAAKYTLSSTVANRAQAQAAGVHPNDVLRFVVAAHNAGFHGALTGYQAGDVDAHTTHGDYSAWVMEYAPQIGAWIAAKPNWQLHLHKE